MVVVDVVVVDVVVVVLVDVVVVDVVVVVLVDVVVMVLVDSLAGLFPKRIASRSIESSTSFDEDC